MNYWITTHWPLLKSDPNPHRHVYLQQRHRAIGERFRVGDRVLIYESASGPSFMKPAADGGGGKERLRHRRGLAGIVATAEVAAPVEARPPGEGNVEYGDGRTANWAWVIPTRGENYDGFVPRVEVLRVLHYSTNWNMHGFGEENSGIRQLTEQQYNELEELFRTTPRPPAPRS